MSRVTAAGAGFGALSAVRNLRAVDRRLQIDVIASKAEFVYHPGTTWKPTDPPKVEDPAAPLHSFFHRCTGSSAF